MRLAANEGNFTHRVSAVHLMCHIYQRSGQHKEKIRQYKLLNNNYQRINIK